MKRHYGHIFGKSRELTSDDCFVETLGAFSCIFSDTFLATTKLE